MAIFDSTDGHTPSFLMFSLGVEPDRDLLDVTGCDPTIADKLGKIEPLLGGNSLCHSSRHGQKRRSIIGTPKGENEFFRLYENAKKDPAWSI
jgi:hypothetical protein